MPREGGLRQGEISAPPYYSQRAVFASPPSAFFIRFCDLCNCVIA